MVEKREDYGSVISPRMRQRVQFDPVVKNGDVNSNQFPKDWPYPPVDSALSRPGWGVGFETPVLSSNHLEIRASKDKAFREELHQATADYILYLAAVQRHLPDTEGRRREPEQGLLLVFPTGTLRQRWDAAVDPAGGTVI